MLLGQSPRKQIFTLIGFHNQSIIFFLSSVLLHWVFFHDNNNGYTIQQVYLSSDQAWCWGSKTGVFIILFSCMQIDCNSDSHRASLVLCRALNECEPGSRLPALISHDRTGALQQHCCSLAWEKGFPVQPTGVFCCSINSSGLCERRACTAGDLFHCCPDRAGIWPR